MAAVQPQPWLWALISNNNNENNNFNPVCITSNPPDVRFNTASSHTAQGMACDQHQNFPMLGWQLTALEHISY
jgi:hypothetical protein